jgi:putative addiction module component (TIGR02574 family)
MSAKFAELGIDRMSADERLELAQEIWDSLADQCHEFKPPAWHLAELDQRLAAAKSSPKAGAPWEEVKRRILESKEQPGDRSS